MKNIIYILVLIFPLERLFAQESPGRDPVKVTGKIMNAISRVPVPFAHIINISGNSGTSADGFGEFSILAGRSDSLRFSAIGFENKYIIIGDSAGGNFYYISVYLKPASYMLEEVNIYANDPMKGFRRDTTQSTRYSFSTGKNDPMTMVLGAKPIASGYITAFANQFNRHARQEKKLENILEDKNSGITAKNHTDSLNMVINARYNSLVIGRITDLSGVELDSFTREYRPSDIFILTASEYDFTLQIVTSFRDYREKHGLEVDMEEILRRAIFKN